MGVMYVTFKLTRFCEEMWNIRFQYCLNANYRMQNSYWTREYGINATVSITILQYFFSLYKLFVPIERLRDSRILFIREQNYFRGQCAYYIRVTQYAIFTLFMRTNKVDIEQKTLSNESRLQTINRDKKTFI